MLTFLHEAESVKKVNSILTVNILHVAVHVIELIVFQHSVVSYPRRGVHVSKTALSWHLNGVSVDRWAHFTEAPADSYFRDNS